ncbi:MAG: hypothetical protein ABJC63_16980, partial [Gemmatimonadales bacterium]
LQWLVEPAAFVTKGRNTPYAGTTLTGRAVCTVVGGRVTYRLANDTNGARNARAFTGSQGR